MADNDPHLSLQLQQRFTLSAVSRAMRGVIFEYALISALIGLNPFPNLFSLSLVLVGLVTFKLMRDIGSQWGYPKGQDILAIAGNLFGGIGALVMAFLAWMTLILIGIYLPVVKVFALSAAFFSFTWVTGQATTQYYEIGQAKEPRSLSPTPEKPLGIASGFLGVAGNLKRRHFLLGVLAGGLAVAGFREFVRIKEVQLRQTELGQLARSSEAFVNDYLQQAFDADRVSAEQLQAINNSVKLLPATVPYDREMSKLLIRCNRLGTEQYLTGTIVTDYDGAIQSLPSFDPRLAQYRQIASFIGPEEATTTREVEVPQDHTSWLPPDPLRQNLDKVQRVVEGVGGQVVVLKWLNPVYWGFVLISPAGSIISFRGTQRTDEWVQNALIQQVSYTDLSPFKFEGQVHSGFAAIYGSIAKQVVDVAQQLDKARPVYVTGHSLGASLAMLAGMDIALQIPELRQQLRVYTYAGPRVGNPAFAEAHSRLVPNTYRVVNLADAIPMAPPTATGQLVFINPGQLWGFLNYTGDAIPGHFVSVYRNAIDKSQETLHT